MSAAIDRESVVRLVYRGRATPLWDQVTPGNKLWVNAAVPQPPQSLARAAALLRSTGFTRRPDGILVDSHGQPVEFSILTNPSNVQRTKLATIVHDDLAQLGMQVHAVPLEFQAVMARIFDTQESSIPMTMKLLSWAWSAAMLIPTLRSMCGLRVWQRIFGP